MSQELKHITPVAEKKILEVGAGTGRDGIKLSALGSTVYLLDYSLESLRLVRRSTEADTVTLILADARCCPFKDNTFDIVFHQGLLEHFPDPSHLLCENHRILKKGGFLLVDVPQTFHLYTVVKHILLFFGLWFAGWERQFTIASLAHFLQRYDFEPLSSYGDWSRPGLGYKVLRAILMKVGIVLPMFPHYFGRATEFFYTIQNRLRKKKIFLYTVLSIGIIAKKI